MEVSELGPLKPAAVNRNTFDSHIEVAFELCNKTLSLCVPYVWFHIPNQIDRYISDMITKALFEREDFLTSIDKKIKAIENLVYDVPKIKAKLYNAGDLDREDVAYISDLHDKLFDRGGGKGNEDA